MGYSPPPRPRRFRREKRCLPDTVRRCFRKRFHPLVSFTPLQSSAAPLPAFALRLRRLPWVCRSLFATSAGGIRHDGFPSPSPFRPRRFARPRRLPPPPASWVCFAPQPRSGFHLQGASLAISRLTSSVSCALSSLASRRCHRLPGSATSRSLALRAFIRLRVRCSRIGV